MHDKLSEQIATLPSLNKAQLLAIWAENFSKDPPPNLRKERSPVTSRSNCAKDKSTLRVNLPMEVVVLNCWVTETKLMPCLSNLPLAFLAPDITEAILDGKQGPNLSLEKCVNEIPFEWALQRAALAKRIDVGQGGRRRVSGAREPRTAGPLG